LALGQVPVRRPAVHPQLQVIRDDFDEAKARLHRLAASAAEPLWTRRPDPARWSMAECVAHLNLSADAYLPLLHTALDAGRRSGSPAPRRYRRDPVGWLLWRTMAPPVRHRVRTPPPFVPTAAAPLAELIARFDRGHDALADCVAAADGLPLGRLWITSPFNARARYNAYACLSILPRHEHRHLWQAERVLATLRGEPSA
jgi:DinB superfamily